MINGGAISAKDLQLLLNESYEKREQDVGDYEIDKDLSNLTTKVFKKKGTDEVFIVHRGSYDRKDWIANFNYLRRGYYNDDRLKQARKIQKATEDKYGANNVSTLGHSKGSKVAEEVGGNSKEIITLNKPTHITDIFRKVPKNQTDIKTSGDPVSLLRPLQRGNKPVILESDTSNPITEHKLGVLDNIDDVYGRGNFISRISGRRVAPLQRTTAVSPEIEIPEARLHIPDQTITTDRVFLQLNRQRRPYPPDMELIPISTISTRDQLIDGVVEELVNLDEIAITRELTPQERYLYDRYLDLYDRILQTPPDPPETEILETEASIREYPPYANVVSTETQGKGVSFSREEEAERRNRLTLEINALMNRYRQLNYIGLLQSWERSGRLPQQFRETRIRINQLATAFTDHILQIQILYSGRLTRQKYIDLEMHLDSANEVLRRLEEAVNSIVIPAYAQLAEPTPLAVATPIDDEDETEAVEATPIQTRGYGLFRKKIYNR